MLSIKAMAFQDLSYGTTTNGSTATHEDCYTYTDKSHHWHISTLEICYSTVAWLCQAQKPKHMRSVPYNANSHHQFSTPTMLTCVQLQGAA